MLVRCACSVQRPGRSHVAIGWVIKIGRGLDFYQKPASWHEIGVHDLALRRCLETKVDVFRVCER